MAVTKGKTLWEIMQEKMFGSKEPEVIPVFKQICNPLDAQPGRYLGFDVLDYRGKQYGITKVSEWLVTKDGMTQKFANYEAVAGDEVVSLLVIPTSAGVKAILFSRYDSVGADSEDGRAIAGYTDDKGEKVPGIVSAPVGDFKVDIDDKDIHEQYFRVDDVKVSYMATVRSIQSPAGSLVPSEIEYWDYWRKTQEDGVDITQYFYVLQDTSSGWLTLNRGAEIDIRRVTLY